MLPARPHGPDTESRGESTPEVPPGGAEGADAAPVEHLLQICPTCGYRLNGYHCKLICAQCGYYMSCADYY